ncbi:MAG TPA: T9SS type A sorting domain-containing protein, partial [Candidatus Kapabacteria bacterium]|nr:T9SS type A sorting domain-containing protein [Candidatus Kapabacteria bacterium]
GAAWTATNTGLLGTSVNALVAGGGSVYAGGIEDNGSSGGGVYRSTDEGANWELTDNGMLLINGTTPSVNPNNIALSGGNIFVATITNGVYRSTDGGNSWATVNNGLKNLNMQALMAHGGNLYSSANNGASLSTDGGASWTAINNGMKGFHGQFISSFAADSSGNLYAGTVDTGVFISTNGGGVWTPIHNGLPCASCVYGTNTSSLAASSHSVFAATDSGIYRTTNFGAEWIQPTNGLPRAKSFGVSALGNYVFVGVDSNGIYYSSDDGVTWVQANTGLPSNIAYFGPFTIDNKYIYAGTTIGVWRRPISDFITAVDEKSSVPAQFTLQNYPNPFGTTTNIEYRIPNEEQVTLRVYNALGEEIATLVNGRQATGTHDLSFDASNLPNGVYFYRLSAGRDVWIGRMTVLR